MKALSITTASTLISPAGPREFLEVYNNGTETIYVAYDGDAAATVAGSMPLPVGARLVLDNSGNRNLYNKAVYGISPTVTNEVRIAGLS